MSTSYHHFTINERESLLLFCRQGLSIRAMARMLGRSPSSVSRELRRNCTLTGTYSANAADKAYRERRKACVRKRRLDTPELKAHVSERLLCYWSPEQIAGRLKYLEKSTANQLFDHLSGNFKQPFGGS